ncbi:MAG: hypothetical protein H6983_17005 [Ectothiorhodospiraceae bacterium]|nr:hypothetical protein [Ectothiorhodospiraceae bacterium]
MSETSEPVEYTLGADDTIEAANPAFWRFASANEATLTERDVLGTSLFRFIADTATAQVYRALHRCVRETGRPLVLPYRCDSPERLRGLEMVISPLADSRLLIRNLTRRIERRPGGRAVRLAHGRAAGGRRPYHPMLRFCSICNRGAVSRDGWMELHDLVSSEFERFAGEPIAAVTQPCSHCIGELVDRADSCLRGCREASGNAVDMHRRLARLSRELEHLRRRASVAG